MAKARRKPKAGRCGKSLRSAAQPEDAARNQQDDEEEERDHLEAQVGEFGRLKKGMPARRRWKSETEAEREW